MILRRGAIRSFSGHYVYLWTINQDHPEVIKIYKHLAGPNNTSFEYGFFRSEALQRLVERAGEDEAKRKELLPLLKIGISTPSEVQIPCINIVGSYGTLAKDFVPILKKLKLSSDEDIRDAASKALDLIGP